MRLDSTVVLKGVLRRAVMAAAAETMLVGAALLFAPDFRALALRWYLIVLAVIVVIALDRLLADSFLPTGWSTFDVVATKMPEPSERPERLEQIERYLGFAQGNMGDFRYHIRPVLRDVAADRLTFGSHGVNLKDQPEVARAMLGEEVWQALWPEREPPIRRGQPGIAPETLETIIAVLERL